MGTEQAETHCEWCGADYPQPRDGGADAAPETRRAVKPPPTSDAGVVTHCEWCGAEYPEPDEG